MKLQFNEQQKAAISALVQHTKIGKGTFIVLRGPAGTGKTACLSEFLDEANVRTCVTAPTNKAVKVIREVVGHKADTATIYSLLGIALMTDGEVKNIARPYGDKDLSDYDCVVIDEAGMLNKRVMEYIRSTAEANPHIAWIGIGDQCQLPPVNEVESEIWQEENQVHLTKVERTDNQILTISTHVRRLIETGQGINKLVIAEDYDEQGGVLVPKGGIFSALEQDSAAFLSGEAKALAWRNATVDNLNRRIRRNIHTNADQYPWLPGDRVAVLERAKDFNDQVVANTDDEGEVTEVNIERHPIYKDMICYVLSVKAEGDEEASYTLWGLHEDSLKAYNIKKQALAEEARADRRLWKNFWAYAESFHTIRPAYSTTAHRSQGSTYTRAYVNYKDILANRNQQESLRCAYVAFSRPRHKLFLG